MKNKKRYKLAAVMGLLSMCLFCASCDRSGYDQSKCLESVEAEFEGGEVRMIPNEKYRFLVRDSEGAVWYIETMNSGPEVSQKSRIFD